MFQSFETSSSPEQGPPRLADLRAAMAAQGIDGFIVPRADAHQGEYVAPCDDRLAWLTGFTGSAGFAVVLRDKAGVFIDGRYRTQVKAQIDTGHFTPVNWPEVKLTDWVIEHASKRAVIAYDPWLHTADQADGLAKALEAAGLEAKATDNLVDAVWEDQPPRPTSPLSVYPDALAGTTMADKLAGITGTLKKAEQSAVVLTLPDSIAWVLNIRGGDIPRIPIAHAFAILHADATVDLFTGAGAGEDVRAQFGKTVRLHPYDAFLEALEPLTGAIRIDPASAPMQVMAHLNALQDSSNGALRPVKGADPCLLPKACKTPAEIKATTEAHLRDGAAVVEFLAWLDDAAPKGGLTEIEVVEKLEGYRRATGALRDIAFETICGAGPNGAIVHYRVSHETNRTITPGELLLVDSGGQYLDGTTDITRTIATGTPTDEQRACFTRVLQGMIAVSRVRWPKGLSGRDLDGLARAPLWMAGQDFDHGTGHGVGVYLSVHEGPQRLSRASDVALKPGMILSNEPGYYREGAFGIRIENLVVVTEAPPLDGGDDRRHLSFDTLTWAPIDTRLVAPEMLSVAERDWLNHYHAQVRDKIGPRVSSDAAPWLDAATAAI